MHEPSRRPGRPPDASSNTRALDATRELLVQRGFEATTIRAVAEQAGIHASAIYRRWPSRIELIAEATFPGLDPRRVRPSGDLRHDLRRFIRAYLATFDAPASRRRSRAPGPSSDIDNHPLRRAPPACIGPAAVPGDTPRQPAGGHRPRRRPRRRVRHAPRRHPHPAPSFPPLCDATHPSTAP